MKEMDTPKMTERRTFQKYIQIIKFLIVIINYEHFSKDFGKHIYFQINQNQLLQDLQTDLLLKTALKY